VLEARFSLGRAAFERHRYAESAGDFEAALARLPEDPVLLENLKQAKRYAEAQSKANKNKK
jgi:cytochrome c-type biogenesis protein CcmH/NrfG